MTRTTCYATYMSGTAYINAVVWTKTGPTSAWVCLQWVADGIKQLLTPQTMFLTVMQ